MSSAQTPEEVAVDPQLKKYVTRYASDIPSTIQTIDIREKVWGERLSPDGTHMAIVTAKSVCHVYSTEDCKELFHVKIRHNQCFMTDECIVFYSPLGLEGYDLQTGDLIWTYNNKLIGDNIGGVTQYIGKEEDAFRVLYHDNNRILVLSKGNKVTAISVTTGNKLWTAELPDNVTNVTGSDNSNLSFIYGDEPALFNIANGQILPINIAGELTSQILLKDNRLYAASIKNIQCWNIQSEGTETSLQELWSAPLPNSQETYSYLYQVGDNVVVINMGCSMQDFAKVSRNIPCPASSVPFIATYDANTGRSLWTTPLSDQKEIMTCIYATDSIAYACSATSQRLLQVSMADGKIEPKQWDQEKCGQFKVLSWDTHFRQDPQTLHFDRLGFGFDCALTMDNDAYRVSAAEAPQLLCKASDVYYEAKTMSNGFLYLGNHKGASWLVSPDGQPLYYFPHPLTGSYIGGNTMVLFTKNKRYGVIHFTE